MIRSIYLWISALVLTIAGLSDVQHIEDIRSLDTGSKSHVIDSVAQQTDCHRDFQVVYESL